MEEKSVFASAEEVDDGFNETILHFTTYLKFL